jgi:hypothetical protein
MNDSKKTFNVRVIPHAKQSKIIEQDGSLRVYTNVAPEKGRANDAVIEMIAQYFNVPKSKVVISKGLTSRDKIVVIQ